MELLLLVAAVVVGLPAAVAVLHLSTLVAAALFYRQPRPADAPRMRFLVLVPARNEEPVIEATVSALQRERREGDIVLVVADRCTDRTAELARAGGALVLERVEGDPPGRAAALNDGLRHAASMEWDVVTFVDADAVVEEGYFEACEQVLATGALVANARAEALPRPGPVGQAAVAASALSGVALPRGRDRLGGWVRLRGCGMVLHRSIAEGHTFGAAGASEDSQLSLELCLAGVRHRHIDGARVRYAVAPSVKVATGQSLRYESGRMYVARRYVPRLLRAGGRAPLDAALHCLTPPVSITAVLLMAAAVLAAAGGWTQVAAGAVALLALLLVDEIVALVLARVGWRGWAALALAPAFLAWKSWIQLRALLRVRGAADPYEPTPRT